LSRPGYAMDTSEHAGGRAGEQGDPLSILKRYWGYDEFRGVQRDIIDSICQGRDTLGLMPTGGGKSIAFQVPALMMSGMCLVVTPIIALMEDQVAHLARRGIKAAALHSGMKPNDLQRVLGNAVLDAYKLLYVSPERLATEQFRNRLRFMNISFVCVDEAHCISQWGHDFRPEYLQVGRIRDVKPDVPILALTATATPRVVKDIMLQLGFRQELVYSMSFARKNLSYVVRETADKAAETLHILSRLQGSAIVYTRSREKTEQMAHTLCSLGVDATHYHAGMSAEARSQHQAAWQRDEVRVMVATNAFGMGIDKPDVRVVVHIDCPDSIEEYFQEAGRAGRDGEDAYAVLLYDRVDDPYTMKMRIDRNFPPRDYLKQVYDHLGNFFQVAIGSGEMHSFEFNEKKFCTYFHHFPTRLRPALRLLASAGHIEYSEDDARTSRLRFLIDRDQLYRYRHMQSGEDKVIEAMLRTHTGLFVDFQQIDEQKIAKCAAMDGQEVYLVLKSLARQGIVEYVPKKNVPHICFTHRRERADLLQFPPEVYEDRKNDLAERVDKMLHYLSDEETCRSRMLLEYFGETGGQDCGRCDVCRRRQRQDTVAQVAQQMMTILSDGHPHPLKEMERGEWPLQTISQALRMLLDEELVAIDGDTLKQR